MDSSALSVGGVGTRSLRTLPHTGLCTAGLRRRLPTAVGVLPVRRGRGRLARIDLAAILQLVLSIDNDDITWVQAAADAHGIRSGLRDGDGLNLGGVAVLDDIDVRALWATLNSR